MSKTITKTHKIRIYPNKEFKKVFLEHFKYQVFCFNRGLDSSKELFNKFVELKEKGLEKEALQYWPSYQKIIGKQKEKRKEWELVYNQSIIDQQSANVEKAWKNFRNANMPKHERPKRKNLEKELQNKTKTITVSLRVDPSSSFKKNKNNKPLLKVPSAKPKNRVEFPPVRMAENVRFRKAEKARVLTILNSGDEWYAIVTFNNILVEETKSQKQTAVDVNIKHFDYIDQEDKFKKFILLDNSLEKELVKVKKLSRELSKKRNAFFKNNKDAKKFIPSNNYLRTKDALNKSYTKAVNITIDKLRKFVSYLTNNYGKITIEDLNVAGMKMNKKLSKNLHRAGFGRFKELLETKSKEKGIELVFADMFYPSTQRCSECGYVRTGEDKLGLSGDKYGNSHYEYKCLNPKCQAELGRDENAVENLLQFSEDLMSEIRATYYQAETKNRKETLDKKKERRRIKQKEKRLRKALNSDK